MAIPYPNPIYGVAQRWSGAGWLFVAGQVKEKIQWLALDIAETYDNVIINLAEVIDDRLLVVDQRRRNLIGKDHLADLRAAQFVVVLQCAVRAWVEDGLYVVDALMDFAALFIYLPIVIWVGSKDPISRYTYSSKR